VTREPTKIAYTGATSPRGNRLSAAAHLQDRLSRPLAGMTVQFTLQGQTTSAVTDGLGNTSATIPYNPASPAATITVAYGGDDTYAGSSATAVITRTGATPSAFSTRDASAVGRIGGPAGVLLLVCLVALLLAAHLQRPNIRSQR
jgi:hypothetical protein